MRLKTETSLLVVKIVNIAYMLQKKKGFYLAIVQGICINYAEHLFRI